MPIVFHQGSPCAQEQATTSWEDALAAQFVCMYCSRVC